MGILVSKDEDENSILQEKINADLRERVQSTSEPTDKDFAETSDYVADLQKTGRFSWIWIVLIILALISLVFLILL